MMLMFKIKAYAEGGKTIGVTPGVARWGKKSQGTWGTDANGNVTYTPKGGGATTTWNSNGKTRGKQATNGRKR